MAELTKEQAARELAAVALDMTGRYRDSESCCLLECGEEDGIAKLDAECDLACARIGYLLGLLVGEEAR